MEKQNEKGGSTGSGTSRGSSGNEGPGKMNTGSGSVTGASGSAGKGASTGSTGSSRSDGPGKMNQGAGSSNPGKGATGTGNESGRNFAGRTETYTETKSKSSQRKKEGGDGMLSDIGINKNQVLTALGVVAGGALLYKGARALTGSGKGRAYDKKAIVDINTTLKVKRPKEELYAYWRNLENLPNFMSHIEDVRELSDR